MSTLGKDAEKHIMQAIEKVAELVHDGATPNDAIVKVAAEHQLRPGYITVLTHAYNTGETTRHRQDSEDLFGKSAAFELADADVIMDRLFPKHVKTAAELRHETAVSFDYAIDPAGMIERRNRYLKRAEKGFDALKMCEPPAPLPVSEDAAFKKTARELNRGKVELEEARRLMSATFDKAAGELYQLREYFKQPGSLAFSYVQEKAAMLHGEPAVKICNELASVAPGLKKQAGHVPQRLDMYAKPFVMMQKLATTLQEFARLERNYLQLEEKYGTAVEAVRRPFVDTRAQSVLDDPSSTKSASFAWNPFTQTVLGSFTKDTLSGVANKMGPPADDSLKGDALDSITDPAHEATLKNIRAQATLHDLMHNDEVIKGYPKHETMLAFNDIANLSPRSIDQRAILQTMLRQRLAQGQLSNFELDQALGMEQKLRQREGTGAPIQSVI